MRLPRLLVLLLAGDRLRRRCRRHGRRASSVTTFAASNAGPVAGGAGGARDLDVRDGVQRPLLHLFLSAAHRRRDRLVRVPARRPSAASCSTPGERYPTPTAACPATRTARRGRHRDLRPALVPGRRHAALVRRPRGLSSIRPATSRTRRSTARRRTGASTSGSRACDLRFGTSTGALGFSKFPNPRFDAAAWEKLGGWEGYAAFLSDDPDEPGQPAEPALGRLGRAAVPDRHGLRRLPHRLRPGEPAGRPDHPGWENIDALVGNQYSRSLEPARQRAVAAPARVAADRARAPGHRRHLGAADGRRLEPGDDERDHQPRAAPRLRGRGAEVAQGRELRGRRRSAGVLVRAGPGRQVLAAQHEDRAGARTS